MHKKKPPIFLKQLRWQVVRWSSGRHGAFLLMIPSQHFGPYPTVALFGIDVALPNARFEANRLNTGEPGCGRQVDPPPPPNMHCLGQNSHFLPERSQNGQTPKTRTCGCS